MTKIFRRLLFILLLVCSVFVLADEKSNAINVDNIQPSVDNAQIDYKKLVSKNVALLKTSESNIEFASKIIDWSAMIFAALAILLIVAGAIGLREFSRFKSIREEMTDETEKLKEEIHQIKGMKEEIQGELNLLKEKIHKESDDIFKTIYLLNEAITNFNAGNLHNAITSLKQIRRINKTDYEATCLLARSYSGLEQYQKAIETTKVAISLSDNPFRALYIMAECYRRMDKYDEAIDAHKKSLKLEIRTPTLNSLAYCYYRKQKFQTSEIEFRKSIKIYRNASGVIGVAKSLLMQDDREKAREYAHEAVVLAKENIENGSTLVWPYFNLASAYFILNNEEKCFESINLSILRTKKNKAQIREQICDYELLLLNKKINQKFCKKCIAEWNNAM